MTETDRRRDKPINKRHMHCYRRAIYDTLVEMKWALFPAREMQQIRLLPL